MGNANGGQKGDGGKKKKKGGKASQEFPFVPPEMVFGNIWQHFREMKILGKGASCSVVRAQSRETKKEYAMKIMKKDDRWNPILFK